MDKPHLEARKAPKQARSLVTVQAILTAGARVLARESLAGFNTNRIAEVAGVSVGSLYQYFPNKAALAYGIPRMERARLSDPQPAPRRHKCARFRVTTPANTR